MSGKSFKPRRLSNPPFQMLWKWLEQGGSQTGNGQHHHGTTIAGVVGLNEANLREIEAKTAATTWRKLIGLGIGNLVYICWVWQHVLVVLSLKAM